MKTALITGASGGIGYELAKLFAKDGYNLVVVARREKQLEKLKAELEAAYGIQVRVVVKNLIHEEAPQEIFQALQQEQIKIDVLVNNAGFGDYGDYATTDWSKQQHMIQVNIMALTHLTRLFIGQMMEQNQGKILNLASTAAFEPGPKMAIYYATKAFVLSFSEALVRELKNTGVTVTALCPGPTATGFSDVAYLEGSKLFKSLKVADVKEVAAYGYRAMKRGKAVAIHGGFNKLLIFSLRLTPRKWVREIVYKLQSPIEPL